MLFVAVGVFVGLIVVQCVLAVLAGKIRAARIRELYVYPVKSMAGIAVPYLEFDDDGLILNDRCYAVVSNGTIVTQRDKKRLGDIVPCLDDGLSLSYQGRTVRVLSSGHEVEGLDAVDCGDDVAEFLSDILEGDYRLVRAKKLKFHDVSPVHVATTASLKKFPKGNFRYNVLVATRRAFDEDTWLDVAIGLSATLRVVKPCRRCSVTSDSSLEPLKTMRLSRIAADPRLGHSPCFGLNCVVVNRGILHVGDRVEVLRSIMRGTWLTCDIANPH